MTKKISVVAVQPSCLSCPCSGEELYDKRNSHTARYLSRIFFHLLDMHGLCHHAGTIIMAKFVVYFLNKAVYNNGITRQQAADEFLMLLEVEIGKVENER